MSYRDTSAETVAENILVRNEENPLHCNPKMQRRGLSVRDEDTVRRIGSPVRANGPPDQIGQGRIQHKDGKRDGHKVLDWAVARPIRRQGLLYTAQRSHAGARSTGPNSEV